MSNANRASEWTSTHMQTEKQLEDMTSQIKNFVLKNFPLARQRSITENESLLDSGIVDSLGVLEMVEFLEKTFSITIYDEELIPKNFHSIQSIAVFIKQKIYE
jgi:acyl carrier protein